MPFLTGYNKRKALKYGTTLPGSNLTGFPFWLSVTGDTDIASELASGGGVAFTLADGTTTVPFGLYPTTALASGDVYARMKFDPLSSASTGTIFGYVYYDHTQTTSQDKANTVGNGYSV